jgi:hypothetical protein
MNNQLSSSEANKGLPIWNAKEKKKQKIKLVLKQVIEALEKQNLFDYIIELSYEETVKRKPILVTFGN